MRSKRPDFLFSVAIRFLAEAQLREAGSRSLALRFPGKPTAGARSLLDWVLGDQPHPYRLYYWLGFWALGGGGHRRADHAQIGDALTTEAIRKI